MKIKVSTISTPPSQRRPKGFYHTDINLKLEISGIPSDFDSLSQSVSNFQQQKISKILTIGESMAKHEKISGFETISLFLIRANFLNRKKTLNQIESQGKLDFLLSYNVCINMIELPK